METIHYLLVTAIFTLFFLTASFTKAADRTRNWELIVSSMEKSDPAIQMAVTDFIQSAKKHNIFVQIRTDKTRPSGTAIVLGSPERNKQTAWFFSKKRIVLEGVSKDQGYEIRTLSTGKESILFVSGGSILGDVYGLYGLRDRLRVLGEIPALNVRREPLLDIRCPVQAKGLDLTGENSETLLKNALTYGVNWVVVGNTLNFVPWEAEPEKSKNRKNREEILSVIQRAHALHMKCFTYGDEFTYHPSLLKKYGAALSLEDPNFWQTLQEKYRLLLKSLPELDGVGIRTGELTQLWGNYEAFNVIHGDPACSWSLEKRYGTFVKKIYDVVVGQFHKLYYQRTWVTNLTEQHSNPEVFKKTFTRKIPVKNLYLVPKVTTGDQGWFQPFNPTFNLTPHHTLAEFESMDVGQDMFPTFPAAYFQAALQTILEGASTNVQGMAFDVPPKDDWGNWNAVAYILYRLNWDLNVNVRTLARDFAAIHFGQKAADKMAEIYLLTPVAYKYGLYIEPIACRLHQQLPQLRGTIFPVAGFPVIDHGKAHLEFWRRIYLQTKPWMHEALNLMDHGLQTAQKMISLFQEAKPLITDKTLAEDAERKVLRTEALIQTNNLYVKTAFSYFDFLEDSSPENYSHLKKLASELSLARLHFAGLKGKPYHFFGIDQLLKNVEEVLENKEQALNFLKHAPTTDGVMALIERQEEAHRRVLNQYGDQLIKILHWRGRVDGKDILVVKAKTLSVQHVQWEPIQDMRTRFYSELPESEMSVVIKDIHSRTLHPFVLQQPTAGNHYTTKIYLVDAPGGGDLWELELYAIKKSPKLLGLWPSWQRE